MSELEKVEIFLEGLDKSNITSLLTKWEEIKAVQKELEQLEEMIKTNVKIFLKERKWSRYMDDKTKISVSLDVQKRETIDNKQLKMMITDAQYAQIMHITTFEKLCMITPKIRRRLKEYAKHRKK